MVHGIDISKHQGEIDWQKLKDTDVKGIQIEFIFIKATEGVTLKDKKFTFNWNEAKEKEIIRGAYHYFKPNQPAYAQSQNFLSSIELEKNDLPAVLDIEEFSGDKETFKEKIKVWLDEVEEKTKMKPIIYTNSDFYQNYLEGSFNQYPLWVAHYYLEKPEINRDWSFWQHNDTGNINGIKEKVDFNVFSGSLSKLKSLTLQE